MAAYQVDNLPCPVCGQPRWRDTSHTAKNPDRDFVFCKNKCDGAWRWVDSLPKYAEKRPLDLRSPSQRTVDFLKKVEEKYPKREIEEIAPPVSSAPSDPLAFLNINPIAPKKELVWSEYQEKIFDFVERGSGHGVVIARAGAAKTTTGMECLERIPETATSAFVAFGVDIVDTLRELHRGNSYINTTHALCFENARAALPDLKFNQNKLYDIFDEKVDPYQSTYEMRPTVVRLVNGLKATLREPTAENMDYLVERYTIEVNGDADAVYELARKLYLLSLEDKSELDYEDMLHWTAIGEIPARQFDYILGDEFQDMTIAQTEAIAKSLSPDGRVVCVADPKQSLYGFRFSDTNAVENAIARYQAQVFALPISYRCPTSVIRLAQKLVPDIMARPDAPEGSVKEISSLVGLRDGDTVLCRMNKYLVAGCFDLIRQGHKATILGRDIGNNLISMLQRGEKKSGSRELRVVMSVLADYVARESDKYLRSHKEAQAASLQDRYDTLVALAQRCRDLGEVKRLINTIFTKDKAGITFSTIHKYKGRESERVFIIEPQLLNPQKFDKQAWELEQLTNAVYVAVTRAKSELYFVGEKPEILQ